MSVRVTSSQFDREYQPIVFEHANAERFEVGALSEEGGYLKLYGPNDARVAVYAPACWASAEILPEPGPRRIEVLVDVPERWIGRYEELTDAERDSLEREALRALATTLGHGDGWTSSMPQPTRAMRVTVEGGSPGTDPYLALNVLNAVQVQMRAHPEPVVNAAERDDYPEAAKCPSVTLAPAEAVLSETTEPYVSVSVSGNDPETVATMLAKLG